MCFVSSQDNTIKPAKDFPSLQVETTGSHGQYQTPSIETLDDNNNVLTCLGVSLVKNTTDDGRGNHLIHCTVRHVLYVLSHGQIIVQIKNRLLGLVSRNLIPSMVYSSTSTYYSLEGQRPVPKCQFFI